MTIVTVGAAEVKSLKSILALAQKEAKVNKAAADKEAKELEVECTTREQHEAWVGEVEQKLKDATISNMPRQTKSEELDWTSERAISTFFLKSSSLHS